MLMREEKSATAQFFDANHKLSASNLSFNASGVE
jgi:hypothetical protein